jgi:hypothetical protein
LTALPGAAEHAAVTPVRMVGPAAALVLAQVVAPAAAAAQTTADLQHSPVLRIVVVVASVVVGIVVGLIPALLLGTALGVLPRPLRARLRRRATRAPAQALPAGPAPVPIVTAFESHPAAWQAGEQVTAPRVRHRELYDAEYSKQLLQLETLRRRIGIRLASPEPPPADDVPPATELDEWP